MVISKSIPWILDRYARAASSHLDRDISVRTVIITVCGHQSDGMLKAILYATVSMVSKLPTKALKALERAQGI